eukprot:9396936-Prorocentrum_lima.AAC.1
MTSSLVGSEMCIRDRQGTPWQMELLDEMLQEAQGVIDEAKIMQLYGAMACLLYTSDAADDM